MALPQALRNSDSVLWFSHRTNFLYAAENSVQGIEMAAKAGFKAVELDISRAGDGQLIVFHDEDGQRLLGMPEELSELSTAEIKKHPILFADTLVTTSHVPTLAEVLENQDDDVMYYLDMKESTLETADRLAELLNHYAAVQKVIVASSDILFVFYIEENYPEIITAHEGFDAGKEWTWHLMPDKLKPDLLSGNARNTDPCHLRWLKEHQLLDKRIVYGVDTANIASVLQDGYRNIIVDYHTNLDQQLKLGEH